MEQIIWLDACQRSLDMDNLNQLKSLESGKELLSINTTYGEILKVFDDVIAIGTENSEVAGWDVTFIPRVWILEPEELRK